jgi:hypothetical protein
MNKTAGIAIVIGLVLVAGYLWLTGALSKGTATASTTTGAAGGANPLTSGGVAPEFAAASPVTALLASLGLTALKAGPGQTPQAAASVATGATLEATDAPIGQAGTSQGDFLPATPPPTIPVSTDSGLSSNFSLGNSFDVSGDTDITSLAAPVDTSASIPGFDDAAGDIFS